MKKKWLVTGILASVLVLGGSVSIGVMEASANNATHLEMNGVINNLFKYAASENDCFVSRFRKENVTFDEGIMSLNFRKDEAGYVSGEYGTQNKYGYGMYQVKMKPAKGSGVVSSFFSYTEVDDADGGDEIDIEFLGKDTTKVQFNYWDKGHGGHEYMYDLGFDASDDFHVYGYYWNIEGITWYVDGEPVHTAYQNIPENPGRILMNLWTGNDEGWMGKLNYTSPMKADYDWFVYDEANSVEEANVLAQQYLNKTE